MNIPETLESLAAALLADIGKYEAQREWRQNPNRESRESMIRLLVEPLTAFLGVWHYKMIRGEMPSRTFSMSFAFALGTSCSGLNPEELTSLSGDPERAFAYFCDTLEPLLSSWRDSDRDSNAWLFEHEEQYRKIQRAQQVRSVAIVLPGSYSGPAPGPINVRMFRHQRSYKQASETAALCLWGDFLSSKTAAIDFCKECQKPFKARSNKQFCSVDCGKNLHSNKSHKGDIRRDNSERMLRAAMTLKKLLSGKSKIGEWWMKIDPNGSRGRRSRWVTGFVRVALNDGPDGIEARNRILDLCIDERMAAQRQVNVRDKFEVFLQDIRRANTIVKWKDTKGAQ